MQEGYGSKADMWSFAAVLYDMAVGEEPFRGQFDNIMHAFNVMRSDSCAPTIPDSVDSLLRELLALLFVRDPAERASTAL